MGNDSSDYIGMTILWLVFAFVAIVCLDQIS
jgi:hypothetical protein